MLLFAFKIERLNSIVLLITWHPSKRLLPAIVIISHVEENMENIMTSLEEFKGIDTFFVSEWLRQKGLEKLSEIVESK